MVNNTEIKSAPHALFIEFQSVEFSFFVGAKKSSTRRHAQT